MKVMMPSGVGRLSVASNGTMTIPARMPPWMSNEVKKVPMDLAALVESGVTDRANSSFLGAGLSSGAFFATTFGAPFGS